MPRPKKYDGIPISPPIFMTAPNNRGQKKLYPVFKDRKTDAHLLQCEECGRFISLPGNRSLVNMEKHVRSLECSRTKRKQDRWKIEEEVRAEAEAALAASGLQFQPAKPLVRQHPKNPIVEAQSLLNVAGTISFSIPLHVSSPPSGSTFENVFQISPPVNAETPGSSTSDNQDSNLISTPTSSSGAVGPPTTPAREDQRPYAARAVSPADNQPLTPAVEFSSDSEDDEMEHDANHSRTTSTEDSGSELSDTEVESIQRIYAQSRKEAP